MSEQFVFVDRYSATGRPYPDPKTVCRGRCEGMGCYPVQRPRNNDSCRSIKPERVEDLLLWDVEHDLHCNLWGVLADLWNNRQWWYWQSIGRDIWRMLKGKGYCDGWHFVGCSDCHGTGKAMTSEEKAD